MRQSRDMLRATCATVILAVCPVVVRAQNPEEARITAAVRARPEFTRQFAGRRVEQLRFSVQPANPNAPGRSVATMVVFDHTRGVAYRLQADANTGEVLQIQQLRGRPAASAAEIAEAERIVRADPQLARAFEAGAVAIEGIIVDPPAELPPARQTHRIMQVDLLTRDRNAVMYALFVDLTDGAVALRLQPPR